MAHIAKRIENHCPQSNYQLVLGGETRQESTSIGVQACRNNRLMINGAARPFVGKKEVERLLFFVKFQILFKKADNESCSCC